MDEALRSKELLIYDKVGSLLLMTLFRRFVNSLTLPMAIGEGVTFVGFMMFYAGFAVTEPFAFLSYTGALILTVCKHNYLRGRGEETT